MKRRKARRRLICLLALIIVAITGIQLFRAGLNKIDNARYPQKYRNLVERYAKENQMDPLILYSVIRTESGFDPQAVSNVEARGLMQITEETFDWIKSKIAPQEDLQFKDLYNPEVNIRFGAYYFAQCMERYQNDLPTAAAAYHSGWGTVDELLAQTEYSSDGKVLHTFPYQQMKRYVYKITKAFQKYQQLYAAAEIEGTL